jgi:solute carrier family 25 protein 34/35
VNRTLRPGFYEPFRRNLNKFVGRPADDQIPITSVIAGASSGAVGGEQDPSKSCGIQFSKFPLPASLGNPLFLIKARMQVGSALLAALCRH